MQLYALGCPSSEDRCQELKVGNQKIGWHFAMLVAALVTLQLDSFPSGKLASCPCKQFLHCVLCLFSNFSGQALICSSQLRYAQSLCLLVWFLYGLHSQFTSTADGSQFPGDGDLTKATGNCNFLQRDGDLCMLQRQDLHRIFQCTPGKI
jgi:hypothetical protein